MDFTELYTDTCSSLTLAARQGNFEAVKRLIRSGFPTNHQDNKGWRPLHHAASCSNLECVRQLLSAEDADVNAQGHDKETALLLACQNLSSHEDSAAVIKVLLAAGADPNPQDVDPWIIPLNVAVANNNCEVVKDLLEAGADVNIGDAADGPPILVAAFKGYEQILTLLLDRGADLHKRGDNEFTVLHSVLQLHHSIPCLHAILNHPACNKDLIDSRASDGTTPLMLACQAQWVSAAFELLDRGADANLCADDKVYALHMSIHFCGNVKWGRHEKGLVDYILEKMDCAAFVSDYKSGLLLSPFVMAIEFGRYDVVQAMAKADLPADLFHVKYEDESHDDQVGAKLPSYLKAKNHTPLAALLTSDDLTDECVELVRLLVEHGSSVNAISRKYMAPLSALTRKKVSFSHNGRGGMVGNILLENGANMMHCSSNDQLLPDAVHMATVYNPEALFFLFVNGVPAEMFTNEVFRFLQKTAFKSDENEDKTDINKYVLQMLLVVNLFTPQLSHEIPHLFVTHTLSDTEDTQKNAEYESWRRFFETIETPKPLLHLCILWVRNLVARANRTRNINKLLVECFGNHMEFPKYLSDVVHFRQFDLAILHEWPLLKFTL